MPGSDLSFLERPVLEVAPLLLGAVLTHDGVAVRLTEVEAYAGLDDPGSHAGRGRTARNQVMFGPAGRLYVYLIYGMHHCANVAAGPTGHASALLLRAGEVVAGLDVARARRPGVPDVDLARGPARLCTVLGLDLRHNHADLAAGPVRLVPGEPVLEFSSGPRVGLRLAADRPWRFWVPGDPTVSTYRPAKRR